MGLFDFFKKKVVGQDSLTNECEKITKLANALNVTVPDENNTVQVKKSTVPDKEKKFYQPDEYYTDVVHPGTVFEHRVVSFEERKKTAIPSSRGLYPAEILLLEYCKKGNYPGPKNGYPGFWWFEYGIRDVGAALEELAKRGYIVLASAQESVKSFTVQQLKELLTAKGCKISGKKDELISRVIEVVSEEELIAAGVQQKYMLTEVGVQELLENEYVAYMHKTPNKTTEDTRFGALFNVWSINILLGDGDKTNWKSVVDAQEQKMYGEISDRNAAFMDDIKEFDPEG